MATANTRKLYPEERRQQIQVLIAENGRVSVDELTLRFDVSKVTIRGDLDRLEQEGVVQRTHGGAIALAADVGRADPAFLERQYVHKDDKKRIGRAAAELIHDGMTVFLDATTNAIHTARAIRDRRSLTVVTNCLPIAMEFDDAPGVTVVILGGIVRPSSWLVIGAWANLILNQVNIDVAFMGSKGLTAEEGLTDVNAFLIESKRTVVQNARKTIALVEFEKWGRVAFASYASLEQLAGVITDDKAPANLVAEVRRRGVEVTLV